MEKYQEILERAQITIKYENEEWYTIISVALDKLSIGKALMLQAIEGNSSVASTKLALSEVKVLRTGFREAEDYLNQAVDGLRESGYQDELPRGLLARAACYRSQGDNAGARSDLQEAREIAERSEMRLYLADYHLESYRLELAENNSDAARIHLDEAETLIRETGYHRRDSELAALRERLA